MSAHQEEIERIANLLDQQVTEVWPPSGSAIVAFVLDNYRPRIEWTDETPDPDPNSDDLFQRIGGMRYLTAVVRVGPRKFRFTGRLHAGMKDADAYVENYKHQIVTTLGRSMARWMDGDDGPTGGEPINTSEEATRDD
jgi:hypothetical protein